MADTTEAKDIGEAGSVLESVAKSVKAANDIIKGVSDLLPNLTRSIVVEVDNITSRILTLTGNTQFVTGGFGPTLPQGQILPSKSDVFSFVGHEPIGGVNGMVTYSLQGVGEFNVAADNPIIGTNSVNVFSNPSVDNFVSIIGVHSDGNHNHARFAVIEKSLLEKGTPPPLRTGARAGNFIQSSFGKQGNFELLVPVGGRLMHFFRNNDEAGLPWHKVAELPNAVNAAGAALIQSNFGGNFEVVARLGDTLNFYVFASKDGRLQWSGPMPILVDGQPITGVTGF